MRKVINQRELGNDNGLILRAVVESGETFTSPATVSRALSCDGCAGVPPSTS